MKNDRTATKERKIVSTMQEQSRGYNTLMVLDKGLPLDKIAKAKDAIDVYDTNSITTYGLSAQKAVNSVSDDILRNVKSKDVGPVADSLNQIVASIRGLDTVSLGKKQGFLAKMFRAASPVVNFLASYETTTHQIDAIIGHLDNNSSELSRSVARLDILYRDTEQSAMDLEIYIAALKEKMAEFESEVLPVMKKRAEENLTPMAGQEYSDAKSIYDRMDRKYHNLSLTRQVTLQNLPSIRLTQEHDVSLLEKINDVQVNLIPLWKRQLAIALEAAKTDGAGKAVNATTDLTNEMLVIGAKQLGRAQIEAQKTIERGMIDVDAVTEANATIVNTVGVITTMIADGRKMRREAEQSLLTAETDLRKAITAQ